MKKQPFGQSRRYEEMDRWITKIAKIISYIGAAALFVICVIATINVLSSKIFNYSINNITEYITYLNLPLVFFCVGYVQLDRGHTHIDLLYKHFPSAVQKIIHFVGYIIGIAVCGFAGWRSCLLALEKLAAYTYAAGPSSFLIWPYVLCIGLGYIILSLCFMWSIVKELNGRSPYSDITPSTNNAKGEDEQ